MDITTAIALSRLTAQSRALDVTAANIANADTPGFKAERMQFTDYLTQPSDTDPPPGGHSLAFVQDRATWRDWSAGTISRTGNPLDLALGGGGFFTVMTPQGPRLTRAGHFTLGPDGTVQDMQGDQLLDNQGKPILIPPGQTHITVAGDGTLDTEAGPLAKIGVVAPAAPNAMLAQGARLLDATATTTAPVAAPRITQGAVEESNAQPILEVTRMMEGLRQFQFMTQFVQEESDRKLDAIGKIAQPQPA